MPIVYRNKTLNLKTVICKHNRLTRLCNNKLGKTLKYCIKIL